MSPSTHPPQPSSPATTTTTAPPLHPSLHNPTPAKPTAAARTSASPSKARTPKSNQSTNHHHHHTHLLAASASTTETAATPSKSKPRATSPPNHAAQPTPKPKPQPASDASTTEPPIATSTTGTDPQVVIPVKKRGRPRKYADGEIPPWKLPKHFNPDGTPRGRGRPRKVKPVVTTPPRRGRPPKNKDAHTPAKPKAPRKTKPKPKAADADGDDQDDLYAEYDGDLLSSYLGGGGTDDQEEEQEGKGGDDDDDDDDDEATPIAKKQRINGKDKERIKSEVEEMSEVEASLPTSRQPLDLSPAETAAFAAAMHEQQQTPTKPKPTVSTTAAPIDAASASDSVGSLPTTPIATRLLRGSVTEPRTGPRQQGSPSMSDHRSPGVASIASTSYASTSASTLASPGSHLAGARGYGGHGGGGGEGSKLLRPTSSDAYFVNSTSRRGGNASMSTKLISSLLPALDPSKLESAVSLMTRPGSASDVAVQAYRKHMLGVYEAQLKVGYSIVFYGVGSKMPVLLEFLRQKGNEGDGVGVVVQGSVKGLRVEEILAEVERATGIGTMRDARRRTAVTMDEDDDATPVARATGGRYPQVVASSALVERAKRIASYFSGHRDVQDEDEDDNTMDVDRDADDEAHARGRPPRLYLLLESFDAPALQAARFRPVLETLAAAERIHVMACVEHVNAGLLAGLETASISRAGTPNDQPRSIGWIWQNMTTFVPPIDEMLLAKLSGWMTPLPEQVALARDSACSTTAAGGSSAADAVEGKEIGESAALHILKSVTVKARALFSLLVKRCDNGDSGDDAEKRWKQGLQEDELRDLAKRNFLASTQESLNALMVEFRDHGVVWQREGRVGLCVERQVAKRVVLRMKGL
ncbi:Origin recognition complex subunit 2 [Thecaphora frezii]